MLIHWCGGLLQEQVCFGDSCAHECHCTGDEICNSSDGDYGEAECDTGSDYQYYGPPACQRVKKSLNTVALLNKEAYIQTYMVSSNTWKTMKFSSFITTKQQQSTIQSSSLRL